MKKLILFLLLVGCAGYAYWPYHATGKFRDALNEPDAKALETLVDWPAVRDSLKMQLQTKAEQFVKDKNRGVIQPAQVALIKLVVEKGVGEKFTAENLAKDAKKRHGKPDLEKIEITSRNWASSTEFTAKTNMSEGTLKFALAGTDGWKLVDMQLGPDEVDMSALLAITPPAPPAANGAPEATPQRTLLPAAKPKEQWIFKDYKNPLDKRPR